MTVYVLAIDGLVQKFPYTISDLRRDNPTISFPVDVPDDVAADFNVFPVAETPPPTCDADTERLAFAPPELVDGAWVQRWSVEPLSSEEIAARLDAWRNGATCTPFQGRMALAQAGLMPQVDAIIAAADDVTKTAWEYALEWKRTSPMIAALAGALELTETQVDDLFKAAQQITA